MNDVKDPLEIPNEIVFDNEIKKKLLGALSDYQKTMVYLSCDAPIEVLCLSKSLNTLLVESGITRVHDILNFDLTKIKGLGDIRRGELATSLEKFIPMFG